MYKLVTYNKYITDFTITKLTHVQKRSYNEFTQIISEHSTLKIDTKSTLGTFKLATMNLVYDLVI